MFKNKILSVVLTMLVTTVTLARAQPPDFAVYPGEEEGRQGRREGDRLERMTEYLELSEAQVTEWQAIAGQHKETMQSRWEHIGDLRNEFRQLADQDDPNLEQLGQLALDLHREMETARASRGALADELQAILTPEQTEKFEALKAAGEIAGGRRHRGPRGERSRSHGD